MKMDKTAINKIAKEAQKKLQKVADKQNKNDPITSKDSEKDIAAKLKNVAQGVGKPDLAAIKKEAKEIRKKLGGKK